MSKITAVILLIYAMFYTNGIKLQLKRVFRSPPENNSELFSPMTFEICTGTPYQCFFIGYDTGSYTTWLPDEETFYQNVYESEKSSTYKAKPFQLFSCETETTVEGIEFTDLVNVPSISEKQFYFNMILANNYKHKLISADGNAGFARLYDNDPSREIFSKEMKRFSFVEYLFNVNLINQKIFYHRYLNDTHGELIIGEKLELNSNENVFYCKCVTDEVLPKLVDDFWKCKLDELSINKENQKISDLVAVFSTGEKYMIFPYQLGTELMNKYKMEDTCTIKQVNEKESIMECNDINVNNLPELKLTFGEYSIVLKGKNLFFKENKKYIFAIKASSTVNWLILGDPLMKIQNFVFDSEKNSVGFIEKKFIQKNMIMSYLLWGILGFCVIAILFFALSSFIRYKKRVNLEREIKNLEKTFSVNEMGIRNDNEVTSNYTPLD